MNKIRISYKEFYIRLMKNFLLNVIKERHINNEIIRTSKSVMGYITDT